MLIGLTGGIASGKTLVSSILRELGACVICADEISRELTQKGMPALEHIRYAFGASVFYGDGSLNRKALGAQAFGSESERKRLEEIMHPLIEQESFRRIENARLRGISDIVLDAALLIESGLYKRVDRVWVVISSSQMERLIGRDNLSDADAMARINAQMTNEQRVKFAHAVIDNSSDAEHTRRRVYELWKALKEGEA